MRRIFQAHVVNKDRVVVINRVDGGMGAIFVERFIANIDPIEVSQLMSQLGHFRPSSGRCRPAHFRFAPKADVRSE